jgi:hypothetical protein
MKPWPCHYYLYSFVSRQSASSTSYGNSKLCRYSLRPLVQAIDFRLLVFCGCRLCFPPLCFPSSHQLKRNSRAINTSIPVLQHNMHGCVCFARVHVVCCNSAGLNGATKIKHVHGSHRMLMPLSHRHAAFGRGRCVNIDRGRIE